MAMSNFVVKERELSRLWAEVKFLPEYACQKCDALDKDNVLYMRNAVNHFGVSFVCHGGKDSVLYSVSGQDMFNPNGSSHAYGDMSEVNICKECKV